jgi:hypothetical protein
MKLATLPEPKPDEDAIQLFMNTLGATRDVASRLAIDYWMIEDLAYASIEELLETGVDPEVLRHLHARARRESKLGTRGAK